MPRLAEAVIKLLHFRCGQLSQGDIAEFRLDMRIDNGAVVLEGRILLVAAILAHPDIQPFAQRHFGGLDVLALVDLTDDLRQLLPDFLLRRAENGFLDLLAILVKAVGVPPFPASAGALVYRPSQLPLVRLRIEPEPFGFFDFLVNNTSLSSHFRINRSGAISLYHFYTLKQEIYNGISHFFALHL